ncbi:MAG: glutamyl-tRNA amidotransferase [Flavobacteriaceae bacterium]|nr:glutamyl-tRNA amidotransferase [Flavobacteriaceae bacterium]|tara:strand:- start:282 stop:731 length:450 start_codon:yes stop_codon:yes gene_type:complete
MSLKSKIEEEIISAMKSKASLKLESLRAIKSAIILFETKSGSKSNPSHEDEIALLQKLVKQRKESATIFNSQGRVDLAEKEIAQERIISEFLPKQLSIEEVTIIVKEIVKRINAEGMKDMGKVMGLATKELLGKSDGKTISQIVRSILN